MKFGTRVEWTNYFEIDRLVVVVSFLFFFIPLEMYCTFTVKVAQGLNLSKKFEVILRSLSINSFQTV